MTNLLRLIFKIIKAQCKANMSLLFSFSWHITIHWLFLKLFWVSIICQKISGSVFHFHCLYFYYSLTFLSLPNNEKISTWKVKTHLTNWIILLLSPCLGLKNTIILIRTYCFQMHFWIYAAFGTYWMSIVWGLKYLVQLNWDAAAFQIHRIYKRSV